MTFEVFFEVPGVDVECGTLHGLLLEHVDELRGYVGVVLVVVEVDFFGEECLVLCIFYLALEVEDEHLFWLEILFYDLRSDLLIELHVFGLELGLRGLELLFFDSVVLS